VGVIVAGAEGSVRVLGEVNFVRVLVGVRVRGPVAHGRLVLEELLGQEQEEPERQAAQVVADFALVVRVPEAHVQVEAHVQKEEPYV
jgi:hypothetical protein